MSLYYLQKLLYNLNRDERLQQRFKTDLGALLDEYELTDEEREALQARDIGKLYVLGVNGQLLMHLSSQIGQPWAEYIAAMREGVAKYGPVRAGIYAMTTAMDEKVAGV
jgi:Aromatic-ring-opening dioxygenase LigAB, LigA subunit